MAERFEMFELEVKTIDGQTGKEVDCRENADKWIHFFDPGAGALTGTYQIEGSIDGSNFSQIGSNVTVTSFVQVAQTVRELRIKTVTNGNANARLGGRNTRME